MIKQTMQERIMGCIETQLDTLADDNDALIVDKSFCNHGTMRFVRDGAYVAGRSVYFHFDRDYVRFTNTENDRQFWSAWYDKGDGPLTEAMQAVCDFLMGE